MASYKVSETDGIVEIWIPKEHCEFCIGCHLIIKSELLRFTHGHGVNGHLHG